MRLLELVCATQIAACVAYSYDLFSLRGGAARAARILLGLAWLLLSAFLLVRWGHAGFARAPWLSLGETLSWGAWGLLTIQGLAEWRLRTPAAGFFCTALAAIICLVLAQGGRLDPGLSSARLSPILRNPWVWVHLPSGIFGFGLFLLAAFFALLGLVRSGVRGDRFQCGLAAPALLLLCRALPVTVEPFSMAAAFGLSFFLLASAGGLWLESLDRRLYEERLRRQPDQAAKLGGGKPPERKVLRTLLLLGYAASFTSLGVALFRARSGIAPYFFIGLFFLLVLAGTSIWLTVRREVIEEKLPERESFDRWSHQAALYAFPWLTIHLVSGSVWAYDAWGSFWSWQPQQAWVGITWFYLAWVLHLERGKVSTAFACCAGMLLIAAAISAGAVGTTGAHGFWPAIQ